MMESKAAQILAEAAKTFEERHKVYGNNYELVGKAMKAFFPDGVTLKTPEDHERFHIFMLMIVKLTRYVISWDKGGHQDSIHDCTVYGAMLEMIDASIAEKKAPASRPAPWASPISNAPAPIPMAPAVPKELEDGPMVCRVNPRIQCPPGGCTLEEGCRLTAPSIPRRAVEPVDFPDFADHANDLMKRVDQ
jgi:hypothetical protein